MARVPGTPNEKLALLSTIDQTTLPHLVGDILYFVYNHRDIKVVDGPGDGKRDVHSVKPDGTRHITQCKYHENVQTTVSSSETDELILALMKFACKTGLFVTTGRISPQAKREYLDNYPGFELNFFDGTSLVDIVLASPVLSTVWFDGESLTQVAKNLVIPFVLRTVQEDRPIVKNSFQCFSTKNVLFKFDSDVSEPSDFEPYRPPLERTRAEHAKSFIGCHAVTCSNQVSTHDIPDYIDLIAQNVAQSIDESYLPIIIRFGIPSLIKYQNHASKDNYDCDDKVKVYRAKPISFVIDKSRTIVEEQKWVVIQNTSDWIFPNNLSVAEADWAGWLNCKHNTIFMQQLHGPIYLESYFTFEQRKLRQQWLEKSLFAVGSREYCETLISNFSEQYKPDWYCLYGLDGYLLGWFHPIVEILDEGYLTFQYNPSTDTNDLLLPEDLPINEFEKVIQKVRTEISDSSLTEIDFQKANLISAVAGKDLLPNCKEFEFRTAELYHCYEEVPSPVYLNKRLFLFVRMWQVPASPSEARESLSIKTVSLPIEVDVHWDAIRGSKTKETFILCSLIFTCPPNLSADEYFYSIELKRDEYLGILAQHISSLWSEAILATVHFWRTEIGFQIDDNTFEGNPWVKFLNEKEQ